MAMDDGKSVKEPSLTIAATELTVTDVPRALFFYTEALGLEVFSQDPHAAVIGNENFRILLKRRLDAGTNAGFCFGVSDLDSLYQRFVSDNVPAVRRPFEGDFGREMTFEDPDGNRLRAIELK
jgi:predicted enzyme related to lactoylglutathione lyase